MDDRDDLTFGSIGIDEMAYRLVEDPTNRPTCTEQDWVMYWLPLFIGAIQVKEGRDGKPVAPMMEWTRVSRSALQSVNVVDQKGATLFVIPPLLRSVSVGEKTTKIPLTSMIHHASQLRDAGRVAKAETVLRDYIRDNLEVEVDLREELQTWNDIFGRYEVSKHLVVDVDELFKAAKADDPPPAAKATEADNNTGVKGSDFDEFEL